MHLRKKSKGKSKERIHKNTSWEHPDGASTDPPPPKRPQNSYVLYKIEQFKLLPKGTKDANEKIHIAWTKLTESERGRYEQLRLDLVEDYNRKMEAWKAKYGR